VRVSLGGARDEADIRGHRRTYVGAMPGRILTGIRQAKSKNPVFLLDEIDKLGTSFQGDPASALLEVLDPAQNRAFIDHYVGVPFDLSEVLFICTANFRENIPAPLLDRMEPILFAGYTEVEKVEIARRYLLPRQIEECGLTSADLSVSDGALRALVTGYTREAGVRQLERAVASLARKAARRVAGGESLDIRVDGPAAVRALIGKPGVHPAERRGREEPGVATGMYYTQAGGDIMHVEASILPGRGELVLTGQLGDVMKESGRAALTYARSRAADLGVPEASLLDREFHVHVPAGAIPKDGPSAGVTMALALLSALSARPIRSDVAMTGEITLRGRVLPIGGVKEKILGAHRAGIPEIMLPRENEADLEDLDEEVRSSLCFHLIDTLDDAINICMREAAMRAA
jgi:ATP-dependent Lon protease